MKKLTLCLLALSAMISSSATFAQDTVKKSTKATKVTTHKVTKHHRVVKKTKPAM
ncbi:MAG: hypothetical protein ACRYFA_01180 [Janthinobacterium lividum]